MRKGGFEEWMIKAREAATMRGLPAASVFDDIPWDLYYSKGLPPGLAVAEAKKEGYYD